MFGFIMAFILVGAVLLIVGLLFKNNRSDKEYVSTVKTVVGNVLWLYLGIPFFFACFIILGLFFIVDKDSSTSPHTNEPGSIEYGEANRDSNDRLITGDEQREIHEMIASGMTPDEAHRIMSSRMRGNRQSLYVNKNAGFSIVFPAGWVIEETTTDDVGVRAKCTGNGSLLRVSRYNRNNQLSLTPNRARLMGEYIYEEIQKKEPSAELLNADMVGDFNGHEAVAIMCRLPDKKCIHFTIVPYGKFTYEIAFEGQEDVLGTVAANSITSFQIIK